MKFKTFVFLSLGFFFCMLSAFTRADSNGIYSGNKDDKQNIPQLARIYIEPTQVHVMPEGIFVEFEGTLYRIAEICQDENGYFVPYTGFWWYCRNGHPNPPWVIVCPYCGANRGS